MGFNPKRKGQRSYYPLLCTEAQTGKVLDVLHRSGNTHDSKGAAAFIAACVERVRVVLPKTRLEVRMDSAFFSGEILDLLDDLGVAYTISVPFERLAELKAVIEHRQRWHVLDADRGYFERQWKPKSWQSVRRFVAARKRRRVQYEGPVQLDLFISAPRE